MPSACGYTWSRSLNTVIEQKAALYSVGLGLVLPTIAVESAFYPRACGDRVVGGTPIVGPDGHRGIRLQNPIAPGPLYDAWECADEPGHFGWSHGLLQLNTGGGQGTGMTWSQLVNPASNLDRGLPYLKSAVNQCGDEHQTVEAAICCFARFSGHPGFIACDDPRILNLIAKYECFIQYLAPFDPLGFLQFLGCPLSLVLAPFLAVSRPAAVPLARWIRARGSKRRGGLPGGSGDT